MILGGEKLKLGGGNPPFPRVLYETLSPTRVGSELDMVWE